ncbi:AAA family ATPase [Parahaliea maris]|uniref:AAA family ATPase n=1 Tax=Parahaliea maris TaxID=2716870 RepID=A0A5C9A8F6_9GAMM|nr:AAA family ATPase [Parahaliea maris]TXS95960.1 AAA family ATPase [Parahaliea maris]
MTADLSLRVLGDLKVKRGGVALALPPSRKTRGLLAYLALDPRNHRREQLCELLWEIPDDPRGALRWSLSKIRKLVDDEDRPRIHADRSTVGFDTSDVAIDLCQLEQLVSGNLAAVPTDSLEAGSEAFQGGFLAGLELPDQSEFHTWCIGQRERAQRLQVELLGCLAERLLDDPPRALVHVERLVGLSPYDEPARARLVSLLREQGRKPEAEQHYRLGLQKLQEVGDPGSGLLQKAWRGASQGAGQARPAEPAAQSSPAAAAAHDLVGRDDEIGLLTSLVEQLPVATRPSLLLIRGNPGLGKSALLQLTARIARAKGYGILKASAFESEQVRPFAVWNDALRRALPDNPASRLLSGGEPITRDQAFAALNDLLCEEVGKRPVVILFDDVQWCDESSVSALHYVLRVSARQPFLLVAAARETELRDNAAVQAAVRDLRQNRLLQEVRLQPLSAELLCELIERECPGVDAARLSEQCAGNPLLARELARAVAEGGSGESLAEMVHDRMSRLEPGVAEVLHWAAVLSPRISLNTLVQVTGQERELVERAVEAAEGQGILHPGPRGFRFAHDLVALGVYQQLSPARQQVMHRRVAELLEEEAATDLSLAADLAHHATRSGDPALAVRGLVSAARLCLRFYANDDALELYRKGQELVAVLDPCDRVCLTLELCDVRMSAAPLEDWRAAVEEYVALAEQALDCGALSHARLGYQMASYVRWMHGQWSDARRDSLQAERVARAGSEEAHILGMAEAAKCLVLLERDLPQADAMAMEAGALARRAGVQCQALPTALGLLRYYEGRMEDAVDHLEEARTLCKARGDRLNEYMASEYLAVVEVERGDYAAALDRCQTLLEIGTRLREGSEYPFACAMQALSRYGLEGDDGELEAAIAAVRTADAKQRLTFLLNRAAALDIQHGRHEQALARASEALELARLMERPSEILLARVALEQLRRGSEDTEPAEPGEFDEGAAAPWARERAATLFPRERRKTHDRRRS